METAEDLVNRNITPFYQPGGNFMIQLLAESPNPNHKKLSQSLIIPKNWDEFDEMVFQVKNTGLFAQIGTYPWAAPDHFEQWYRSSETIGGMNPSVGHLANKKWPLKKVF